MARAFLLFEALEGESFENQRQRSRNTARLRRSLRDQAKALALSDTDFKANYRLTKELFKDLCSEVKPFMARSRRRTKISVECKVLTALSFYATGSYQKPVGMSFLHSLSQASVSNAVKEVTRALNRHSILAKYINFPHSQQERQAIINGFSNKFGFPGCLGCIDGTHVALVKPTEHEERFFNRKHYHSRNVQIICDSDLNILNIDASFGGATHDAYIWRNGEIQNHLQELHSSGENVWLLDNTEPVVVTAMCRVGTSMWLADSVGRLFVYAISTCTLSWSVRLHEAVGGAPSAVAALHSLAPLPRLAIALACGRLFIVTSERPEAEGSFVLTELGTATELCCLTSVDSDSGIEVWAGGDRLYTYTVTEEGVSAAESLAAPAPGKLALLAAARNVPVVLGCCSPGVFVYAWCAQTRRASARLDCSKLAPCSESLQSIALDETLNEERCRVTALCILGEEVYVGTAWGCIVVAHAASLRPLTVFRPYEEEVRAIVPLSPHGSIRGALIATFGAGYRPLVQRYAPAQSNNATTHTGFYCLLWRAQHWLPD